MRKTIFVFLGFFACLLGTARSAGPNLIIRILSSDVAVGSEVKVPILVEGAADLGAIELDFAYDPALLEFVTLEAGRMNSGMVDFKLVRPGLVRIASISEPSLSGDGELIVLAFKVLKEGTGAMDFARAKANVGTSGAEIPTTLQSGVLNARAAPATTASPPAKKPAPVSSAAANFVPPSGKNSSWVWLLLAGLGLGILILLMGISYLFGRRHSAG